MDTSVKPDPEICKQIRDRLKVSIDESFNYGSLAHDVHYRSYDLNNKDMEKTYVEAARTLYQLSSQQAENTYKLEDIYISIGCQSDMTMGEVWKTIFGPPQQ